MLVVVLPLITVLGSKYYLEDRQDMTEYEKTIWMIVPSLVLINLAIAIYVYRVIRDP